MKFLQPYRVFESKNSTTYNDHMGKLLHLYGSIPVPKEKAAIVIGKIILNSMGQLFTLGENVDINFCKLHDRIRFSDYFDSLLEDKDVRGHNFEGLVAGLFGGTLSERGSKWDLTIRGLKYSVKFVDHKSKAPEIGRYKSLITANQTLDNRVLEARGITRVFKSSDQQLKREVWDLVSLNIDGWILAYPDNINDPTNIVINKIDKDQMFEFLNSGMVVSPKAGYSDYYSLALSSKYISKKNFVSSVVKIPRVTLSDLESEIKTIQDEIWAHDVFGEVSSKIRPDVLRWIKANKNYVIKKLSEM